MIKFLYCLLFVLNLGLFSTHLFGQEKEVTISIKELKSESDFHNSVRITTFNSSGSVKKGTISVRSDNLEIVYELKLQPNENKITDIPYISINNSSQIYVTFDRDTENAYSNSRETKTFNKGVLEIKAPNKGQLLFKYGSTETLEEKASLERIDLQELPTQPLCLFQYQLIVIPSDVELTLNAEQFQVLKSYVGFGGRIMYLDVDGKLPSRWKAIASNGWGEVFATKSNSDKVDFSNKLNNISFDAIPMFFKPSYVFTSQSSPKGFYLVIVLLFIVFIGPINFYFLHKKNKKFLIFLTSPLLALVFSVLLIIAFFIKEGFYKRYEGQSLTIIDSQNSQAILNVRNSVYFSTISGELERDRNGIYFPLKYSYRQSEFVNTVDSKAHLSGNFAKARAANEFGEIRIFECHSKIVLKVDGQKVIAKNGFGTKQNILIFDCKNQKLYKSNGLVEPDQEVLLELILGEKEHLFLPTKVYSSMGLIFLKLAAQRSSGYMYFTYADTNEFVPFREKDGFLQGENGHTIMGVINQ